MMKHRWLCLLLWLVLYATLPTCAQKAPKPVRVKAAYTYVSDNGDESRNKAVQTALLRARYEALKDVFGERVAGSTNMTTSNSQGVSSIKMWTHSGSELRADWLKTIKEDVREVTFRDGFWNVSVYVEGMAREVVAHADMECHILRNGTDLRHEDDRFRDGDRICLMFQSATKGYLAVYLLDETGAYCLLPYREQADGIYKIEANRKYVFFSEEYAGHGEEDFDLEVVVKTDKSQETDELCVVFSPRYFTKPVDQEGCQLGDGYVQPRNVSLEKFNDWLYKCQRTDAQMYVERKVITVKK